MAARPTRFKARHAKALQAREVAQGKVYSVMAPRNDVPFFQCLSAAPSDIAQLWHDACAAQDLVEREAIDAGRAWRDARGGFNWY